MYEDDKEMAEQLADGLRWLAREGRPGASLLKPLINAEDDNLEEALSWLDDICEGKEI